MKLISMTDFVLSQEVKGMEVQSLLHQQSNRANKYEKMVRYANFLKKPLTLDMFIGDKALFLMTQEIKDRWWCLESYKSVEDLFNSGVDLTLTQHAIKQLGL